MAIDLTAIKKNKKYTRILFISLLVIAVFVVVAVIFVPRVNNLRFLTAQLKEKKADIARSQTTLSQVPGLKEEIKKREAEITTYKRRISEEAEFPTVLKELTILAEDLEVEFLSLEPFSAIELNLGGGEQTFSLSEIPIRIKIKGGYNELLRFIERIEKGDRFVKVENIEIKDDPNELWRHNAEIVVSTFVLREGNPIKNVK